MYWHATYNRDENRYISDVQEQYDFNPGYEINISGNQGQLNINDVNFTFMFWTKFQTTTGISFPQMVLGQMEKQNINARSIHIGFYELSFGNVMRFDVRFWSRDNYIEIQNWEDDKWYHIGICYDSSPRHENKNIC